MRHNKPGLMLDKLLSRYPGEQTIIHPLLSTGYGPSKDKNGSSGRKATLPGALDSGPNLPRPQYRVDCTGEEKLSWLGKMDSSSLKAKIAASIVAISSIHLLKVFMNAPNTDNEKMMCPEELLVQPVVSAQYCLCD